MRPAATIAVPDELIEAVAERVLERLSEREQGEATADSWLRGAGAIADYVGCSRSRIYQLVSARRVPVHKDGASVVARRAELDDWIKKGGAKCP